MPTVEPRGIDHSSRIASLKAFHVALHKDLSAGLAVIGPLDSPHQVYAALQLLVQHHRFQDALDLVQSHPTHCRWVDLAIYAAVALRDIAAANRFLHFAIDSCESALVSNRCRISIADAVFSEILSPSTVATLVATDGLSANDRDLLDFVIQSLHPLVESVRLSGYADGAIQRIAVEFGAYAYGLLGRLAPIADLVKPMRGCHPVPLVLAQLALRRLCEPPNGLPGQIRVEHPNNFSAQLIAAMLDRELYGRKNQAFEDLLRLQVRARELGAEAIDNLCQAIFATATAIGTDALTKGRDAVTTLLGQENLYLPYFDATSCLLTRQPETALSILDANQRQDDPIWWQVAAKANEQMGRIDAATDSWKRASDLLPHPDVLHRFAHLSIEQRRFDDAVRALEKAAERSPEDVGILEQLAFTRIRLRQFPIAETHFKKLTLLQPTNTAYRIDLAICQARSGNPSAALETLAEVNDSSTQLLDAAGLKTEILNSLNRSREAFEVLHQLRNTHWEDMRFLILYMNTAYRAGQNTAGTSAYKQLLALQSTGKLPRQIFHEVSLDDVRRLGLERFQQRESLFREIVKGTIPWLVAESIIGHPAEYAWQYRTQPLRWFGEDGFYRGAHTVYATNGFSVQKAPDGTRTVGRIEIPQRGQSVVIDMSAIITLHRLGRLQLAADFFQQLIIPGTYGDLAIRDSQKLIPHQRSRLEELTTLQDLEQRKLIFQVDDRGELQLPLIDEYDDDVTAEHFHLADLHRVLSDSQLLTSDELAELSAICAKPITEGRQFDLNNRLCIALSTFRSLTQFRWFERVLTTVQIYVTRNDFEEAMHELQSFKIMESVYQDHQDMWQQISLLRSTGKIQFRDMRVDSAEAELDLDDAAAPTQYFDAILLAGHSNLRLIADDRVCQAAILNKYPDWPDASTGSDLLIVAFEQTAAITLSQACDDILQLIRWRYRFLLLEPRFLLVYAKRSLGNLPGPELREIAAYAQESLRDPGILCGPENADLPTPIAFKYYMAWKQVCLEFVTLLWDDDALPQESVDALTRWTTQSLLPCIPRQMLYSDVANRLAAITPKALLISAMFQFTRIPVKRASRALRLIAESLGMTDDEYFDAAGEAADGKYQ